MSESQSEESEANEGPKVAPLDIDGVGALVVGTGMWAVAFVILLLFRDSLAEADTTWWIGVAAAGFLFGLLAVAYTMRRRSAYRRAAAEDATEDA